jgi:hypothetical protein
VRLDYSMPITYRFHLLLISMTDWIPGFDPHRRQLAATHGRPKENAQSRRDPSLHHSQSYLEGRVSQHIPGTLDGSMDCIVVGADYLRWVLLILTPHPPDFPCSGLP